MPRLSDIAEEELAALTRAGLHRTCVPTRPLSGLRVERAGKRLVNFSSNDYLALAQDPAIKATAIRAVEDYGAGAGASRLITGDHPLYERLEADIAAFKGTEAAVVFGSGYLANLGLVPMLVGRDDLILADRLSHACLLDGAKLAGGGLRRFAHNDMNHLEALLRKHRGDAGRCLILTEGVFSMDGDLAPLPDLAALARTYDAWLMVDDAHALGVVGGGRGSSFAFDPPVLPDIQMGTLSKAAGSYGGYVAGRKPVIDWIVNRARTLIFSTGLPPAAVAAAAGAIAIMKVDTARVARPLTLARRLTDALGLPAANSAIVPIIQGEPTAATDAAARLDEAGFLVTAIRPPTVPKGTARLRITVSSGHSDADVDALIAALRELGLAS